MVLLRIESAQGIPAETINKFILLWEHYLMLKLMLFDKLY